MDRQQFREAVMQRDNNVCVFCHAPAVDAHHLLERRLWADGGYHLDNGISVCETCHLLCEMTVYTVEDGRQAAGISAVIVPDHMYADTTYDKWGNVIREDGTRVPGELFDRPSVQKLLSDAGVLHLFSRYMKYPRTYHLPWSHPNKDDRVLESTIQFEGRRVIVTEKMDGENTTMYNDYIHARSLDSDNHPSRTWVKGFWAAHGYEIPEGFRVCGENMFAQHSIAYHNLMTYFYGHSVWNGLTCLSWDDTLEWFQLLGVEPVPVIYDMYWDEAAMRRLADRFDTDSFEGYVVRVADSFEYKDFRHKVAKWVRPNHLNSGAHWRTHWKKNELVTN